MAKTETFTGSTRTRIPVKEGFTRVMVPKLSSDDINNPDALLHAYVGEESPFEGAEMTGETPRNFIVDIPIVEAKSYRSAAETEAKNRIKRPPAIAGVDQNEITQKGKVSIKESISMSDDAQ